MQDIKERVAAAIFMLDAGDYACTQDKLILALIKELTEREAKLVDALKRCAHITKRRNRPQNYKVGLIHDLRTIEEVLEATLQSLGLQE